MQSYSRQTEGSTQQKLLGSGAAVIVGIFTTGGVSSALNRAQKVLGSSGKEVEVPKI